MEELTYNKDIIRLKRLHEEYEKQKVRILALLEHDCKMIGMLIVSEHLGLSLNYFYKIFKGYSISHEALEDLYMRVQRLKQILKLEGKEDK